MARASAAGEQDALRGYGYQHDHVAAAVYDLYLAGREFELRLVDPDVGAVDDCVLVLQPQVTGTQEEVHGYQYKSAPGNLTLASLLAEESDRRAQPKPCLLAQLVTGWRNLKSRYEEQDVIIHLVAPGGISVRDRPLAAAAKAMGTHDDQPGAPSPGHTAAFFAWVRQSLAAALALQGAAQGWEIVLQWICDRARLAPEEVTAFFSALRVDASTGEALPPMQQAAGQRAEDIRQLAEVLRRRVQESNPGEPVVLVPEDVAVLAGFGTRGRLRHSHKFPVDLDRYTPLLSAQQALTAAIDAVRQGYLAVLGSPGSGKSTLLRQATPGLADRVVTYLTFMPGDPAAAGRASAADFLHDLVVELEDSGVGNRNSLPERDVNELRLRFRDLLAKAAQEFAQAGRRTLLVIDGLDHVARLTLDQTLLAELPPPGAVPDGVVIVLGSQTTAPLDKRIQHHLSGQAGGNARVVDLAHHRLTPAAVEEACERLAESTPGLRLSARQVARVVDLVAGHPLALGYVCNSLTGLVGDQQVGAWDAALAPSVSAEAIDAALDRCVRYSGNVADDYAAYLADADDSDALRELLGDLARLRSPINMKWVLTWADIAAARGLSRVRHLFRQLDRHSWMFFHDSFRQFVLEATSVDVLGEPDDAADARRHSFLADECAKAPAGSRERGEEFFHAARAGLNDRAIALATPEGFRKQFLSGASPAVLAEDIRLAMQLTALAGDAAALTGLMLLQSELRARQDALESVDVAGLYLDVEEPAAAIAYALPDGTLRIPAQQALHAAIRLDVLGNPAGKLLFDAADIYDLGKIAGSDQWKTLSAWTEAVVRFRPPLILQTAVRRLFDQAVTHLEDPRDGRGGIDAWEVGRLAVYAAGHAASELWSAGRHSDAQAVALQLEDQTAVLVALTQNGFADDTWAQRLAGYARSALATSRIAQASALLDGGQWDDALAVLQNGTREAPAGAGGGRPAAGAVIYGHAGDAAVIALRIALAASRQGSGSASSDSAPRQAGDGKQRCSTETGEAALAYARELVEALGSPASIVSGDLSSDPERSDVVAKALQERSCHMLIAGLTAQSAGRPVTEDLLQNALPALARPPASQPAGADIDPAAAAHRDRPAIEYTARLDTAVTGIALLNAAIALDVLPLGSLRALIVRDTSALPSLPGELVDSSRVRPHYARYLEALIDIAARHSSELADYAGERIGSATDPSRQNRRREAAANRSYLLRLRQQLGLRLLEHNVRIPWLDQAVKDADREIAASPGAYEHLDALATQISAHAQDGDIHTARQLLARVIPESFTPSWRKDSQLKEWVRWLLAAEGTRPGALLAQATDIAPMLAVLTEATDGAAEDAGALLLEGAARVAPQPAVRLAAWQLGQGALSFADAHESLLSGFADALIDAINDEPATLARIEDAAALLGAVMAGILAPACRFAPSRALERTAGLLGRLAPQNAAAIRQQLARAVDIHVLPGIRSDWRRTLGLPSTPTSIRDAADEAVHGTSQPEADDDQRWGRSEFGLFKATDGSMKEPDIVLQSVTDLSDAFAWRSAQAEAGTFSWLPVLQPLITRASNDQLRQVIERFRGVYDTAAVFLAVACRMQETGDLATATEVARQAIKAADPAAWSRNFGDAVRREAWHLLLAHGDESTCREALRDLAELLASADYWPGLLMLELRKILPVVAPGLPATRIWEQIQGHLHEMRTGLTEPRAPALDGAVRAAWWAPTAEAQPLTGAVPVQDRPDPASVGAALTDLVIIHLDHPIWKVREGATAVLAWLLRHGGSLAAEADARASAVLASTDDHPVLAAALSSSADEPSAPSGVPLSARPGTAARNLEDGEGLGGDGVREMVARAVAAAAGAGQTKPTASLAAAAASTTWIAAQCARQVHSGLAAPSRSRPLPPAYQLSIPAPPAAGLDPRHRDIDMGPYGIRAKVLAQAAGLSPNAVLHRLWRFTELAQRRIPDAEARDRAARATRLDGLLSTPAGQALRAAFGAVTAELIAAGRLDADDEELAPLLELVDIGLVWQPFNPIPGWIPVPVTREWIPADQWLSGTAGRLAEYQTLLATAGHGTVPASAAYVTLTCDALSGASLEFGPVATVIGADHQFAVTDQGRPTERYLLASTFGRTRPAQADLRPSGIVTPAGSQPTIKMTRAEDWLLSDGAPKDSPGLSPHGTLTGQPLIVSTDSAALQTNAACWTCLDPRIASYHGWRPHPTQPLCWQDAEGNLTAATLIWHRAAEDARRGDHDTVGEGSAVLVTSAGLRALTSVAGILRTHQVVRTVRRTADNDAAPSRQIDTAELPGPAGGTV
jgi:AAA ATPase domain